MAAHRDGKKKKGNNKASAILSGFSPCELSSGNNKGRKNRIVWDRTTSDYEWRWWCMRKLLCSNLNDRFWRDKNGKKENQPWNGLAAIKLLSNFSLHFTHLNIFFSPTTQIFAQQTPGNSWFTQTHSWKRLPPRVALSATFFLPFSNKISHDRTKKIQQ